MDIISNPIILGLLGLIILAGIFFYMKKSGFFDDDITTHSSPDDETGAGFYDGLYTKEGPIGLDGPDDSGLIGPATYQNPDILLADLKRREAKLNAKIRNYRRTGQTSKVEILEIELRGVIGQIGKLEN